MRWKVFFHRLMILNFFLLFSLMVNGQMAWEWVNTSINSSQSCTYDIIYVNSQTIYVTGSFSGKLKIKNSELSAKSTSDIFIAKLDSSGNVKWLNQIGSSGVNEGLAITTDNNHNLYLTGNWNDYEKTFLTKYDENGNQAWLKTFDAGYYGSLNSKRESICYFKNMIAVLSQNFLSLFDLNGNQIRQISNTFQSISCDTNYLYTAYSGFIVTYNEILEQVYPIEISSGGSYITSIKVLGEYVYITGSCEAGFMIGDSTYENNGVFFAKVNKNGQVVFSNYGGSNESRAYDIVISNDSNISICGHYNTFGVFDSIIVGQPGDFSEIFVATYDGNNGKLISFNNAGAQGWDYCFGIDIDENNNLYTVGTISETDGFGVDFEDFIVSAANESYFIAKLSKAEITVSFSGQVLADNIPTYGNLEMYKLNEDSSITLVYKKLTYSDGKYNIKLTKNGTYYLWTFNYYNGFVSAYYKSNFWWEKANPIVINSDTTIQNANISLIKLPNINGNNTISGALYDQNENVQRFIDLYLVTDKDSVISYTRSDSLGTYHFEQIPNGLYQIYVNKVGMLMDSIYTINTSQKSIYSDYNYIIDYAEKRIKIANNNSTNFEELTKYEIEFKLFPNPTKDNLNYTSNLTSGGVIKFQLVDLLGNIILKSVGLNNEGNLNLSSISSGFYFLIIESVGYRNTYKIIKE